MRGKILQTWTERECVAYLRLGRGGIIVAIRSGAERGTRAVGACADSSALGQVLLALCPADLDLLLLAAPPQLIGLEGVLGLELGAPVLGDVSVGHD